MNALPLSVLIDFGTPYLFVFSSKNVVTVSCLVFLQLFATGHQLLLSTATSMKGEF